MHTYRHTYICTMKAKVFVLILLVNLFLGVQSSVSKEIAKNFTIIDGFSSNSLTEQVSSSRPIVIHTQLKHYDQPTLKEYQECHENLEKCKSICEGVENPVECAKECPVCPFLIKEEIVVQGINDTEYRPASPTPLNTTNIIRLTNEIRNIIESHQGNISYHNENMINVYQNTSRVGGKFGFGYNNSEPCCIIVRPSKNCEIKKFSTAVRCHRKRYRICGKKCKSRVMMAKPVTVCEKPMPIDESEDYTEENCYESVNYVPYHPHRRTFRPENKCNYIPSWPFVMCGQNAVHYGRAVCSRCQELSYYYILSRGMPDKCRRCFISLLSPSFDMYWLLYPMMQTPPFLDNGFDFDDDLETEGWHQDKTKCILPNGAISEKCKDIEDSDAESSPNTEDPFERLPEAQDEYMDYNNFDDDDIVDSVKAARKRRHTYVYRSKYSKKHKRSLYSKSKLLFSES